MTSSDKTGKTAFEPAGKLGAKLMGELIQRGVILRAMGDSLGFCPPMIITEEELDAMFAPMEDCLDATMAFAKAEGLV